MFDAMVATTFENVQKAGDIAAHVYMWILRGIAHARLRGEVDHALRFVLREYRFDRGAVGEIGGDMGIVRVILETRQARLLQIHIVIITEVVDANNLIAAIKQPHRHMRSDEASRAGDENLHE